MTYISFKHNLKTTKQNIIPMTRQNCLEYATYFPDLSTLNLHQLEGLFRQAHRDFLYPTNSQGVRLKDRNFTKIQLIQNEHFRDMIRAIQDEVSARLTDLKKKQMAVNHY